MGTGSLQPSRQSEDSGAGLEGQKFNFMVSAIVLYLQELGLDRQDPQQSADVQTEKALRCSSSRELVNHDQNAVTCPACCIKVNRCLEDNLNAPNDAQTDKNDEPGHTAKDG